MLIFQGKWAYYLDIMDCNGKYNLTPGFASLREGVKSVCPKDYQEFKKIILWQFELGYKTTRDVQILIVSATRRKRIGLLHSFC